MEIRVNANGEEDFILSPYEELDLYGFGEYVDDFTRDNDDGCYFDLTQLNTINKFFHLNKIVLMQRITPIAFFYESDPRTEANQNNKNISTEVLMVDPNSMTGNFFGDSYTFYLLVSLGNRRSDAVGETLAIKEFVEEWQVLRWVETRQRDSKDECKGFSIFSPDFDSYIGLLQEKETLAAKLERF